MRIVHDQSALHATLDGVSLEDARSVRALALLVKVGAILAKYAALATSLDARVRKSRRTACSVNAWTFVWQNAGELTVQAPGSESNCTSFRRHP